MEFLEKSQVHRTTPTGTWTIKGQEYQLSTKKYLRRGAEVFFFFFFFGGGGGVTNFLAHCLGLDYIVK